jgi:uncharacterized protein (TIGR03435 family)
MRGFIISAGSLILGCGPALAQSPAASIKFEVASVKHALPADEVRDPHVSGGPGTDDPGRITYSYISMNSLLIRALGVKENQIVGAGWRGSEHYDIVASVAPGATKQNVSLMLLNLLEERFGLSFHHETKDLPAYEMTVAKNGPKLKESAADPNATAAPHVIFPGDPQAKLTPDKSGVPRLPPNARLLQSGGFGAGRGFVTARHQTLAQLGAWLEAQLGLPVVDRTGLTGEYDFAFAFSKAGLATAGGASPSNSTTDPDPDLRTALQQELGLKLEEKKLPIDVVAIEHLEKLPTEN